jgi:hypothetical protein
MTLLRMNAIIAMGLILALLLSASVGSAQTLLITTSFDCSKEWDQTKGLSDGPVCDPGDFITGWGGWTTASGKVDQILAAANHPLGTGMGFRHWRGGANTTDNPLGKNNNGGGIKIDLATVKPREVWVRWYMRYQQGFAWQYINYTKELYINAGMTSTSFTAAFQGADGFGIGVVQPASQNLHGPPGWRSTMGGLVSDGKWHLYEIHVKTSSPTIAEAWVDEKLAYRTASANFANATLNYILVGSNQCCVAAQPDMYTDYDDFAISTTGYIGPIGNVPLQPPTSILPSSVRIFE